MPKVEQLFTPEEAFSNQAPPALIKGLQCVREEVESSLTEYTTWKTQLLSLGPSQAGEWKEGLPLLGIDQSKTVNCPL